MPILGHSYFGTMHNLYSIQVVYFVQHLSEIQLIRFSSQFSWENSIGAPYFFLVGQKKLFTILYWSELLVSDSLFSSFACDGSQENQNLRTGQNRNANVRMRIWNKRSYAISELRLKWKWAFLTMGWRTHHSISCWAMPQDNSTRLIYCCSKRGRGKIDNGEKPLISKNTGSSISLLLTLTHRGKENTRALISQKRLDRASLLKKWRHP